MTIGLLTLSVCIIFVRMIHAETGGRPDLIFAYSSKVFVDVDMRDATAALKIYTEEIGRQLGYRTEINIYDSPDTLIREVQNGRFDIIAITSLDFIRLKNKVELELAVGGLKGGKKSVKYLLLTHKNRAYTKLGDLMHKKLIMPKDDGIAQLFLNTALLRQKYGEINVFFSSIEEKTKVSHGALCVFFGQADACITTDVALKTMTEMNPQIGRDLKIMASSPELITSLSVFRKSLSADIKEKTMNVGKSLKLTQRGQQVLLLFKIEDLIPLHDLDLKNTRDLVNEYERLRGQR